MGLQKTVFIQDVQEEETSSHYEIPRDKKKLVTKLRHDGVCTPMRTSYICVILLLAVIVPTLIFFFLFESNPEYKSEPWTCNIKPEYRVPCQKPTPNLTERTCLKSGCCWNETSRACFHSVPSRHSYSVKDWKGKQWAVNEIETKYLNLTHRRQNSTYGKPTVGLLQIGMAATSDVDLRLYIYNPETETLDIPERISLNESKFRAEIFGPEYFSMQIYRREDKESLLFSTSRGPIIASKDYWELSLQFPKEATVFGLGGLRVSSKPKLIYSSGRRLGANPFIIILDADGRAYGILFNIPGPMEFQLLENSNLLIVKSLSTVMWDFSVFAGPTPADVMKQYTSIEGMRPFLPPPWALGLHICRNTTTDSETLAAEDVLYFIKEATARGLLYESDCLQEGFMYQLNFTIPNSMDEAIEEVKATGRKLLLSLPPQVDSSLATPAELFVLTQKEDEPVQETYYGLNVSYPDFFNEGTQEWFKAHMTKMISGKEDVLGGFVLQDNWPAVNTTKNVTEDMDYVPEGSLSNGTLWWLARHGNKSHYQLHNEYGLRHAKLVKSSLQMEQLVLSASTYTGNGAVAGSHAHAQDDVMCTWSNMKAALETVLGLGLAGIPLAGGGPVCGSMGDYDDELCIRWYFMSSVLPLMRVSSEPPLRDPINLTSGYAREAVKRALNLRYSLLAYFYSLFHEASSTGIPVARPMFFDFPTDSGTWTADEQFMIGPALLARPAFYKNAISVPVYLPDENTTWYHFGGGHVVNNGTGGFAVSVMSLDKELVLLLRGGFIVPTQTAEPTAEKTLAGPYNLVVGLRSQEDGGHIASGVIHVLSSVKITFNANETGLDFRSSCVNAPSSPTLQNVLVYGLNVTSCLNISGSNDDRASCSVVGESRVLEIRDLQLDLCSTPGGLIQWEVTNIPQSTTRQPTTTTTTTSTPTTESEISSANPESTEPEISSANPETTEPEISSANPETTEPEISSANTESTEPEISSANPETTEPEI